MAHITYCCRILEVVIGIGLVLVLYKLSQNSLNLLEIFYEPLKTLLLGGSWD